MPSIRSSRLIIQLGGDLYSFVIVLIFRGILVPDDEATQDPYRFRNALDRFGLRSMSNQLTKFEFY